MPSPGSMPKPGSTTQRSSPQNEDGGVIKSTPKKTNEGVKKADENPLPTPAPSLPFTCFPAEIQQGIWIEAIKGPSCHHFNLRKAGGASPQDRWVVHVHEKPKNNDASAYRHWKSLFQVRDRAFLAAFHYHNSKSNIQPITLRRTIKKRPTYMTSAAIDVSEDLVILYLDHGPKKPATFTWFEHMDPHRRNTMDIRYIQMRLEPFRKVAIHYKDGFPNACRKGPFSCYCPDTALNCGQYKACPRELACFLDCFKNLEAFYFVVELKTKAQQTFAAHIKKQISKKGYGATRKVRKGKKIVMEDVTYDRFFDIKTEFLQHPSPSILAQLSTNGPTPFSNPRKCILAAMRIYKNKIGSEPFHKPLAERNKVKFGLLIPYQRDPK